MVHIPHPRIVLGAIIGVQCALRLIYVSQRDCPLPPAPDEAHYWLWSQQLSYWYYSKGPVVAWLIAAGQRLGDWLGLTPLAGLRLGAIVCGNLTLLALYALSAMTLRCEQLALRTVLVVCCMPVFAAGSILMTIDAPLVCVWAWAIVAGYRAIHSDRVAWWVVVGWLGCLGVLTKPTMLLILPTLALAARVQGQGWGGPLLAGCIASLGLVPMLVWNAQHHWLTVRHIATQAGWTEQPVGLLGLLTFGAGQLAVTLGFWLIAWLRALASYTHGRLCSAGEQYLVCCSLPVLGFFAAHSLLKPALPNWPMPAYLAALPLTVAWLHGHASRWARRFAWLICLLGLGLTLLAHFPQPLRPALAVWATRLAGDDPFPLRRLDPTWRLCGWPTLAQAIEQIRAQLRRAGDEPIVAVTEWTIAGELSFHLPDRPTVYTLGRLVRDRFCQCDLIEPHPFATPQPFVGKTFIIVGYLSTELADLFADVGPVQEICHWEGAMPIRGWRVQICTGYRGLSQRVDVNRF